MSSSGERELGSANGHWEKEDKQDKKARTITQERRPPPHLAQVQD